VHAGKAAGINITRPQPVAESASMTPVKNVASELAARPPEAAHSVAAPVPLDASPATSQAVIDPAARRSIPDELPDSETRHPPSAKPPATRDLIHAVGATRQDKPATVVHSLEPAERWPASRVSVADVPAAANERVVNQALDAVREITIDGLAQRKVLQPQRWSMLPEATQTQADNTHVDSGAEHESASDSAPRGQDHADPLTARDTSTPSVRVGTHGGFNAALQQPAAENVSSASVSHAAVAACASPPATAPIAAAPVRLEASPATVPALIDQVVHRLLDAPANGTVTLRLDPPELGTLLVRFQRRGSQLSVTMTAEREDVSRLLRQGLGQLQSSLSQLHEQVSVQVDTHGESRGRGDESALGSRRQREPESRQNEPAHDQDATSSRETPAQRAKRALRDASLDVWS
jgi:flagellar hook-length control protein FliK